MAKQLNVNLAFTADTSQAKAQLQDLQNQLTKIINSSGSGSPLGITKEIQEATRLAAQLKVSLEGATNVNTGKLDLGKFNESLKKGQMTLGDYQAALNNLGPAGNKAFATLASSIMQAEIPIRRSNAALTEMLVTLKNTTRWQISSSILHGFIGSIQSAYGYAQDLNESLNNIRIVTGYNIDQMSKFAKEANKAAKALSTTTTDYTNASLIYYQQGLTNEQVLERTDVTIKMANAAGQSAETVSDQMTAVWNNFADGSKSLEYYADVMTALGAATASSTAEISDGLEKFAAVAETVGLSYEYATASLATITATTRQSADVVGNALKTLFARIQGLNLGETLDDGTTLNKYSQALEKVGISIFESNGQMKEMDNILDEMGSKWSTLSKDQQTALAQTIAGVRQYTQLMALMNHWDFFKKNLDVVANAEGTLDEQAQTYAESWEAAEKRVQAAAERIYNSLLDDEFFIEFNNVLEFTLTGIGNLIDSMGGLPGVLAVLGTTITTVFGKQITASFDNLIYNIKMSTQVGRESVEKLRNEANNLLISDFTDTDTTSGYAAANAYKEQGKAQQALIDNAKKLSEEEQRQAQYLLDQHNLLANNVIKLGEEVEQEEKKTALAERRFNINIRQATGSDKTELDNLKLVEEQIKNLIKAYYELSTIQIGGENNSLKTFFKDLENQFGAIDTWTRKESDAFKTFGQSGVEALQNLNKALKEGTLTTDVFNDVLDELVYGTEEGAVNKLTQAILNLNKAEKGTSMSSADAKKAAEDLISRFNILYNKTADLTDAQLRLKNATSSVVTFLDQAKGPIQTLGAVITNSISVITSFAMLLNSIKGMVDTLNNTEMTFGEKFFAIFTQMAFVLPNVANVVRNMTTLLGPTGFIGAINANKTAMALLNTEYDKNLIATLANIAAEKNMTKEKLKGIIADKLSGDATTQETIATTLLTNAKMKETIATAKETAAQIASNAAKWLMQPAVLATIAVLGLATAAIYTYIQAQEADARAAERAAEAAKSLAEASNRAKQEVTDLKSAFDKYDTALDHLNSLKEGMEGFEEATKAVNDETLALLEKYPELAKISGIVIGKAGSYQLDQSKVDDYIAKAEKKANMAQAASLIGAARASSAQVKADQTQLYRDMNNIMITADIIPENTADYKYIDAGKELAKNFEAWSNLSPEDFEQAVRDYGASLELTENEQNQLVDKLSDYQDEVNNLAIKTQEAATQMANVAKIMAGQILGPEMTEEQEELYQETFGQVEDTEYNTWISKLTGAGISKISGYNNVIVQELEDKISELGLDITLDRNNTVRGTNTNRTFGVLVDGETKTMTVEQMASAIAAAEAQIKAEDAVRASGENNINSQLASQGIQLDPNVSTSLANSLLERLGDVTDKETITELNSLLDGKSASEQSDIINKFLTEPVNPVEQVNVAADSEKYDLEAENVENYANSLLDLAEASEKAGDETNGVSADLKDNAKMASQVAVANSRMNKGLISLAKNFDDYRKTLNASEQGSEEYQTALKGISDAMNDVLGLDDVELSNDFLTNTTNLDLMAQAANGSTEAVEKLRAAAAQDIIQNIELKDESLREDLITKTQELQTLLDQTDLSIGATFDNTEALTGLNELIEKSGMTAEQVQDYFNALGYTPEVDYTEGTQTQHYQGIIPYLDANGEPDYKPYDFEVEESVQIPTIKSLTYHGDAGKTINTGAIKNAGGGSTKNSSKASKVSMTKKSEVVDRYKEIDDQLDDINDELNRTNKLTDRLFGAKRLQQMDKEISILNKQSKALEKKRKEAENYLKIDKQAVLDLNKTYGTQFKIDDSGLISNYEDELNKLYNDLHAAEQKSQSYYTSGASKDVQDKFNQSTLEPIKEKISIIKEVLSQYDETRELFEDLNDQIQDINNQIQDLNYEKIQYKLELKVDIEDAELKRLDYFLNKFSDDFYKMAESAVLMTNKIGPSSNILEDYEENVNKLNKAYQNGDISQAKYIEGLKNARDAIYEQLEALNELDKQMLHYYEDALSAATDELADHTDHMEHLTSALEHYQNLLSIIGKSKDYEAMGNFLQGQADTIKDRLSVAQSYYDVLLQQKDEIQAELEAAIKSGDEAKIKMYQKEWDYIVDETDAAQEQVLSLTEEWAEAMKSVIQNNMEKIADTLEKTLTGGTTFDTLMDGFDKLNTRQEEYLTKTNQIYETNKLMRTASKALDETDNKVAKQKLKNFIDETKGLQETTQLSKYELEIQQAKYDLLLAQIALEEAQNAKSTVRLSRDSEGNFGYVYTADQNKIDDAQQAVDDADNKLYNLSLEGQQQYTEKYLQAEQAMYEELKQLQQDYLDGNIASEEEYELRKSQIQEHYLGPEGILTTYSKLYNVAVQTDANATADYWGQEYGRMTQDTEAWKTAVNDYLLEIDDQIEEWKNVQTTANDEVGGALNNSKKATEDLTTESRNLRDTINDEVIPAISDEIDAVREQTDAYADQRQKLLDLIATYEDYLKELDATISVNSIGFDKDTDYSALMNEYLSKGGKTSDDTYKQLLTQRNAKIDWLKTQGKDKSYWGTYGDETTDMYDRLLGGENWINSKGQNMQDWFKTDYVDDSKLTEIFEALGVPIEEIQTLLTDLKASSDSTGEKIDATKDTIQTSTDNINTKISETTESVNTKASEIGDSINTKVSETSENLNNTFNETKDILNEDINVFRDETINAFENISQIVENGIESIVNSVNEAAGEISSSVGSGFSEVRGEISGLQSQINSLRSSQSIYGLTSFDTGGYTGSWGPEGKLAMLHEKELILNENDTSNLLSTISFIRELVNMIDAQAASASLFNLISTPSPNPNANTLEQKVEITAEFPNVNDRYEIEEAFNNLVNRASQYANKAF